MVIRTRAALLREPAASASASIGRPPSPAARLLTPPEEIRGWVRAGERRPLRPFPEHQPGPLCLRSDRAAELADLLIRVACRSERPVQRGGRAPPPVDPPLFARVPFHPCPRPTLSNRASSVRLRLSMTPVPV